MHKNPPKNSKSINKVKKADNKEKIENVIIDETNCAKICVSLDDNFDFNGDINELLSLIDMYKKQGYYDLFIDKEEMIDYYECPYYIYKLYGYRNETLLEKNKRIKRKSK